MLTRHVAALLLVIAAGASGQVTAPALELEQARQSVAAGKLDDAIASYKRLAAAFPRRSDILIGLAIAEYKARQYTNAAQDAAAALDVTPALPVANLFLGASLLQLGKHGNAVAPLEKAVHAMPSDRNAVLMLAEGYLGAARFDDAVRQFTAASKLTPEEPRVWYGLGQAYDGLARHLCLELQSTAPNSAYSLVVVADSYLEQGRFGSAYAAYRQALSQEPQLVRARQGLAKLYRQTGHEDWAALEENSLRSVAHSSADGHALPAAYAECISNRDLSRQAYLRLTQLPPSTQSHMHAAAVLDAANRHRDAVVEWRSAVALSTDDIQAQSGLAWSFYQMRDYDQAVAALSRWLRIQPDSPAANFLIGACNLNLDNPDAAVPYLEKALSLDSHLAPAHAALGQALLRRHKPDEAIPHLKAALAADADGNTHFQLYRAFQLVGNTKEAASALAQYHEVQHALAEKQRIEMAAEIGPPN